jgi:hypothetical protein
MGHSLLHLSYDNDALIFNFQKVCPVCSLPSTKDKAGQAKPLLQVFVSI